MLARPCDNKICRICLDNVSPDQAGCVVAVPSKKLSRIAQETRENMRIKWDCGVPSNAFHWECWQGVRMSIRHTDPNRVESRLIAAVQPLVERFDSGQVIELAAKEFAEMLASSKHTVCFTGAGISASAGIATYRGSEGIDTISTLGGAIKRSLADGDMTEAAVSSKKPRVSSSESFEVIQNRESPAQEGCDEDISYEKLQPTPTHCALSILHTMGKMQYCITQNCDDLHHKGGFPREFLSELHGNVFCEYCEKCGQNYFRTYCVDVWSTDW